MARITRNVDGLRLGMAVSMSDGWRGKVAFVGGGIVACLADGEKPNENWCGDYRLTGPSKVTISDGKAVIAWRSAAMIAADDQARRERSAAIVDDMLKRAVLAGQWQEAGYGD